MIGKAVGSNGAEKAYVEQPRRCPPSPWPTHLGTQSQGRTVAVLTSAAFRQTAFLPAAIVRSPARSDPGA